jgi:nucleolar GTP-binding protein
MKNKARLPRTAGLRTLTDLTTDLTKAGIDPSRVQERAVMIAKMRAAERKRKRDEEDEDSMDVDGEDDATSVGERESETMDIDGEDGTPRKRRKSNNSGAVISRARAPRSNRQLAGLRDDAVRFHKRATTFPFLRMLLMDLYSPFYFHFLPFWRPNVYNQH